MTFHEMIETDEFQDMLDDLLVVFTTSTANLKAGREAARQRVLVIEERLKEVS